MDFDPLWAFGGWFLSSSSSVCMARIHQTPSPLPLPSLNSSSSSLPTSYDQSSINKATKLHSLLLFCSLLFLFILLAHPPHHYHDHNRHAQPQPNSVSHEATAQALDPSNYHSSSTSFTDTRSSSASSTKSYFWPGRAPKHVAAAASSSSAQREFEASAHEVPSGPNPISN